MEKSILDLTTGIDIYESKSLILHLALIEKVSGKLPEWMINESHLNSKNYFVNGEVNLKILSNDDKQWYDKFPSLRSIYSNDNLYSFLYILLSNVTCQRGTPSALYSHPFFLDV